MMKKKEKKTKSSLSAFRDSNSILSSSSSSSSSSDECSSGSSRSARTEGKKLMQRVKNKQKLDCKKPGASEQQLIETVGGGNAAPESYAPDSRKKKLGEQVTPSSIPVMGHQSAEYQLPSPAQELPEEVNVAGAAAADVQSELQGPQMTKCNTANGDAQDVVETISPVEKAVSSADKSSSSRSSSYEEVEEEDDKANRESCGLSGEVLDTTNESVEMEEEHIIDHANSNGRDHVVDDVCSKSSEIAQISPKVEENGESGGSSTTSSSSGNGTAEATAAETIDQTEVATKCRNGDSDIGAKEGIGVAPETNGTDHHKEGEDVNELLRNVPSDEAGKDNASWEETKDACSRSTHIGDYLVTPAEHPITGSCMEEDVIAVKPHDLQMRGPSSTTVGYTVSTTVETFTNSVTYSKEDGFAGFEEENTSSTSSNSKKKAPYFENHHNDNNDKSMASSSLNSAEGESEVQRVLRLQTTHDLLCPDCGTCITKRVILRKRKRTSPSVVSVEKWVLLNVEEIQSQDTPLKLHTSPPTSPPADDHHHGYHVYEEDWGCLACFTLFFRRVWRRAEEIPPASPSTAAEIPTSSSSSAAETRELLGDYHPPGLTPVVAETIVGVGSPDSVGEDGSEPYYKNKCLPLLFPWQRIATTKPSHNPELLTPLLGDKGKGKMPIPAEDVVQPTQPSQGLLIDTVNKAPEQLNAHAKDDDINCFSLFLPPFPWEDTQQTAQSHEPVVVVAEQSALGSLNVPLTPPTVTRTTSCGEISAAETPVEVLPPPAAINVCDEAGEQGQIEEPPRKASVNCLDLFLPAYPWEDESETTSLLKKTTAAAKQGIEDDKGKGMDKDAEHPTKEAGIKFSDVFHDPIYVTEIEDKITSAEVVNDHASKASFNCLPLLLPPYPGEGATQVPVSQGRGNATQEADTPFGSQITTTTTRTTKTTTRTSTKPADPTDVEHDTVECPAWVDHPVVVEPETRYHFPPKKHHLPHQSQAHPPAPTYHPKDQSQQQPEEITEEGVVGVDPEVSRHPAETLEQATPKATKDQLNKSSSCERLPITPDYSIVFRTPTEDDQQSMKPPMSKSDTDPDDSSSVPSTSRHPAEPLEQATPNASSFYDQQFTKPDTNPDDSSSVPVSGFWVPKEVKHPISQMWDVHSLFSRRLKRVFFPISAGSTLSSEDGLREGLLKENPDTANTDSPTTDISASIPEVYETTSVTTTVIQVHDAPPMPEAVTAATVSKVQEYLKSVVYGGLDVSLISLGVVASAAGGDAKTRTVLAMGLANLIFGSISFFHKVIELHKESPRQFTETVGQSFLLNGCLAFLSFLVFGSLPTLTFGFSFRQSNNHDYKMLATVVVSVISVMLLGCAKVFAKVTQRSYFATLSALIMTGVVAAVAGFYTGEYFSKLLAQFGFDT